MNHLIICGTANYKNAIDSLVKSANGFFDHIHVFSPDHIDVAFMEKNTKILSQSRGAGFWLWKPYFINQTLQKVKENDIVFYVDAGNIFLTNPTILYDKFWNNDIILFDNRESWDQWNDSGHPAWGPIPDDARRGRYHININWTKRACSVIMGLDEDKHLYNKQCNASYQIYKKTEKSCNFVQEYLYWCQNESVLTDSPTCHANSAQFIDHRHDQSVLSLLASKHNIQLLIDPSEWGNECGLRNFPQIFKHHRNSNYII